MTDVATTVESSESAAARRRVNRLAVAAAVAMLPAWSFSFFDSTRGIPFAVITAVALITVLFTLDVDAPGTLRLRPAALWMVVALFAAAVLGLAISPTVDGALLVVPMAASLGLAFGITSFTTEEVQRYVALPLLGTTTFQAIVAVIQAVTGAPTILRWISPNVPDLFDNAGVGRAQGLYDHSYEAAVVALVAIALAFAVMPGRGSLRSMFLIGMGAGAVTVALTQSRSAVLALILILGVAGLATARGDLRSRVGVGVVLVTFLVPVFLTFGGWVARVDETLTTDLDAATLGRVGTITQGLEVIGDHPLFGVGPNGYLPALADQYNDSDRLYGHVHNQSLQIAAELGIPAGIVFTVLLVWAGAQAIRDGYRPLLLYVAVLPFFAFDVLLYVKLVGVLIIAVWAGALAVFHADAAHPRQ
jgi:O-antigen ligase